MYHFPVLCDLRPNRHPIVKVLPYHATGQCLGSELSGLTASHSSPSILPAAPAPPLPTWSLGSAGS
jgi:hypothetical protein